MPERYLGQTLGERYRLTRLLGAGAYAWVYEAVDVELEIPVAVKVLRPEHTGNATAEARFRREATTAARLRHPNIVTVRDVGRGDGATWVAMDLLPTSLARRLQVMPYLPEPDVVRIGLDVAAALAAAHGDNVLHRDIKPDNILIGTTGESIVCDFGLARALSGGADLSATNQVLGTPHYFSPEQARGESLDGRSDLYALGITLYRAATGRLPFEGEDWYSVARQHVDNAPPPPRSHVAGLSPAFESVIMRLLAKRPEERYANASALADALAQLPSAPATGSRLALTAGGTTTTHTIAGTTTGRRRLTGGLLVVLVAIAAMWLLPRQSPIWARLSGVPSGADSAQQPLATTDSGPVVQDSAVGSDTPRGNTVVDATRLTPPPRLPADARWSQLLIRSTDSVVLQVNGEDRGVAPWTDERLRPGRYVVGSSLFGGQGIANCPYSERTDTVVLSAGDRETLEPALARCSVVWLDVTPKDARVSFADTLGQIARQGRADALSPVQLRAGAWRVRAEARACAPFDAVDTLRAGADTVRIVMYC